MGSLLRFKAGVGGGAPGPTPDASYTFLPTEKKFVDVTDLIADAHDSNRITMAVSGTSGQLAASVWLHRAFEPGESGAYVARALKDHFCVETVAADEGDVGEIVLSYYTGANDTGSLVTKTIAISCALEPPASWDMGALTWRGHGGAPLHDWFSDPENWSIQSQTISGQLDIRRDTASGRNIHRLVPSGTAIVPGASITNLSQFAPTVALVAGTTNTVTLVNSVTSATKVIDVNFIADQHDIAPWPATDGNNGSQLQYFWGAYPKYTGIQCMMEDGDYFVNTSPGYLDGFNGLASNISIGVGTYARPPGPWSEGDNWTYEPGVTVHPGFMTFKSRTPWGANLGGNRFSCTSFNTSTSQRIVGVRLTNARTSVNGQIFYNRLGAFVGDMFMVDHSICTPPAGAAIEMRQNGAAAALGNNRGNIFWSNTVTGGGVSIYSLDYVFINNRIETDRPTQDSMNWVGCDSTQGVKKCQAAWNFWVNKEGLDTAEHADDAQMRAGPVVSPTYNEGPLANFIPGDDTTGADNNVEIQVGEWWGNTFVTGTPYVNGLGQKLVGGGEIMWNGDIPSGVFQVTQFCGNLLMGAVLNGAGFTNAGAGFRANYNTMLLDYENFPTGTTPQFRFGIDASPTDVELKNNLTTGGLYGSDDGGSPGGPIAGFAPDTTGSVSGADAAWQALHLNNYLGNTQIRDMVDVVDFFSYAPGQEVDAGCFADKALIDFERHTVDKVAIGLT
jgi:hypothetical protein